MNCCVNLLEWTARVALPAPCATIAKVFPMLEIRSLSRATVLLSLIAAGAQAAEPALATRLEQAARAQLERQAAAASIVEPEFSVAVVTTRPAPPCRTPLSVEPVETRNAARMRFAVECRDTPGWKYEYIVRAKTSAVVAVTAAPIAAGQLLADEDLVLERRDISSVADSIGAVKAAAGQASKRSLRAGELLRQAQLAAPLLVKRGEPVAMVARHQGVEVTTSGEALDNGARGAVVRVRNLGNGRVVRMRVIAAGTVEPVDMPGITR